MKKIGLISFAVFFITSSQAVSGAWWWPPETATIVPQNPTSSDVVVITLSGDWPDSCIPNNSAISVSGNNIYFDVFNPPDGWCLTVITPWAQTQSVGPLLLGTYKVYSCLIGDPYVPPTYILMTEFTVTDYQFVLSTKSLTVPEGQTATFTVRLLKDPCETVLVTIARKSGDPDISLPFGGLLFLFFDSSNYSTPRTIPLSAAEDEDYLNGTAVFSISAPNYLTAELTATESDNDIPSVLYVDVNAVGKNTGRNWTDAFTDLQDALSTAAGYPEIKEIWVAKGIYTPAEPNGNRDNSFMLKNITLKGGFAGFGQPNPDTRNINVYKTVLSGDLNANDGPNFANNGENVHHVVQCEGTVVLDGLKITGGNGNNPPSSGAGIYNRTNCQLTMINCIVSSNIAMYGGGMFNNSGNMTLVNCLFIGNSGLAIYSQPCNLTLINCTVRNNPNGGMDGSPWYTNITLTNCIFGGNGGASESAQIGDGNFTINYCCIQGWTGALGGTGNIGDDPLFADPNNGDYHLLSDSPCIDAGDPNYPEDVNEFDIDGDCRIIGGRIDIGADEYAFGELSDFSGNGIVNFEDFAILANYWMDYICTEPDWCEGCDFDHSGLVDLNDLRKFAENWLWQAN